MRLAQTELSSSQEVGGVAGRAPARDADQRRMPAMVCRGRRGESRPSGRAGLTQSPAQQLCANTGAAAWVGDGMQAASVLAANLETNKGYSPTCWV